MATGKAASARDRKIANQTREARSIPTKWDIITSADGVTEGDWYGIQPLSTPTFAGIKDADGVAETSFAELDNLPSIVSPIAFTEVELSAGSIIAYRRG